MQSNADSGATPIRSTGRAPDEILDIKNNEDKETHVATDLEIRCKGGFVDVRQIDPFKK